MKRRDLLRHLRQHGCRFVREGGNILFGKIQRITVVPQYRAIVKSWITRPSRGTTMPILIDLPSDLEKHFQEIVQENYGGDLPAAIKGLMALHDKYGWKG